MFRIGADTAWVQYVEQPVFHNQYCMVLKGSNILQSIDWFNTT